MRAATRDGWKGAFLGGAWSTKSMRALLCWAEFIRQDSSNFPLLKAVQYSGIYLYANLFGTFGATLSLYVGIWGKWGLGFRPKIHSASMCSSWRLRTLQCGCCHLSAYGGGLVHSPGIDVLPCMRYKCCLRTMWKFEDWSDLNYLNYYKCKWLKRALPTDDICIQVYMLMNKSWSVEYCFY